MQGNHEVALEMALGCLEHSRRHSLTHREIDLVGRWGGEEFAVILPVTALSGGIGVGESLRKAVAAHSVTSDGGALAITASVGAAGLESIHGHGSAALAELFNQADQALYAAKRGGRNRVEAFGR